MQYTEAGSVRTWEVSIESYLEDLPWIYDYVFKLFVGQYITANNGEDFIGLDWKLCPVDSNWMLKEAMDKVF